MTNRKRFSLMRVTVPVVAMIFLGLALYFWGGVIWHPLLAKISGQYSVGDRIANIAERQSDLEVVNFSNVIVVVYKLQKAVIIYNNGVQWEKYAMTAISGKRGPKLKQGDGQIPEGIYRIDALNPNSSYYLSLRLSYPNEDDRKRSTSLGISDFGDDIYIHGKSASIGCISIGDHAIERLFYAVEKSGYSHVSVIIAPQFDFDESLKKSANSELYEKIYMQLSKLHINNIRSD
jgi:murein L,D-transpeptidase YafK